uniref:Uncharacterized protein n=1 Tax=Oryza meridionalis TaxID=40149 RepID=A0A0E0CZK0_9ORYZ
MVLKPLDGGDGGGSDGFDPSAAEHKRHEQIGNLAIELKHQRLACEPSAMVPSFMGLPAAADLVPCSRAQATHEQIGDLAGEFEHHTDYELKYVWMHPEQRYTLIRVKKCGYWEPLDDPSTIKSNGKRSVTIINTSIFF